MTAARPPTDMRGPGRPERPREPEREHPGPDGHHRHAGLPPTVRAAFAAATGLLIFALTGGPVGLLLAVAAAVAVARRSGDAGKRAARARSARLNADLPLGLDLLAACLAAGSPPTDAAAVVADAVGGPLGAELAQVARLADLGADPATSWRSLVVVPELAALGRVAAGALSYGAPMADAIARLADEHAVTARFATQARIQRAAVRITAPLGLCFLPAFLLLGVAPLVAGLFGPVGPGLIRP